MFTLAWTPVGWDAAYCDEYLDKLLSHWTSYSFRLKVERLLQEEMGCTAEVAHLLAIAICQIDQEPTPCPEASPEPPRPQAIWPDTLPDYPVSQLERDVRTYPIVGGGFVSLRMRGEQLHVRLSLKVAKQYGGGYGHFLEGYVRSNQPRLTAAMMAGWDIDYTQNVEERNAVLPGILDGSVPSAPCDDDLARSQADSPGGEGHSC